MTQYQECAECGHLHFISPEKGYVPCPIEGCGCEGQDWAKDVAVVVESPGFVTIEPKTPAAKEWVEEFVEVESYMWLGPKFGCEQSYAQGIIEGMIAAGLSVTVNGEEVKP